MTDPVYSVASDGSGNLFAGGEFEYAGNVAANCIARWDGATWSPLGTGLGNPSGPDVIRAMVVDGGGNLYIGGSFDTAGGVTVHNVARWNGSSWSALGSGIVGSVSAMAADGAGNLYVAGSFSTAGGVAVSNIARWNGATWSALGSGVNNTVRALAVDGSGNLYAGGYFTTAGGLTANCIARWNGASWSSLGTGMNGLVFALKVGAGGTLYAGGGFSIAGGVSANRVARWNGASWSPLGSGANNTVLALALDGAGNLIAGGDFTIAGGVPVSNIARWNGGSWSSMGGDGINDGSFAFAVASGGITYLSGNLTAAGNVSANRVVGWNGTSWFTLGSGLNSTAYALALGGGSLYAGGAFTTAGGVSANHIARWDGSSWSALGSGIPQGVIEALAVDPVGNVYAGGQFSEIGGVTTKSIAQWDGASWSALGSGMGGSLYPDVLALAMDAHGNLYAGGTFTVAGGVSANYIAKWDGSSWSPLGSGMNGTVRALAVDRVGNVYAGGFFTIAGGVSANLVAKWDGASWSALGTGLSAPYGQGVFALVAERDGSLYAGGRFTTAGAVGAENVARWNGSSWSNLGSGIGGDDAPSVTSLAVDGNWNLYVGGVFTTAGTKGSSYFAMWHGEPIVGVPVFSEPTVGFALHGGVPNPFTWSTLVSFDLPRTEQVRLEVFDACGRRVRSLFSASRPAGRHSVTWDGVDEGGRRSAAGVYHFRMQAGSFVATRRLVLVP